MTPKPPIPVDPVSVHGTQLIGSEPGDVYRQKLARITLDSMVQFVGLLDAQGMLEINKAQAASSSSACRFGSQVYRERRRQ